VDDVFITKYGITAGEEDRVFWSKSISIHLFRYRQLQSEIFSVLYERQPAYATVDIEHWQEHMHERITRWYSETPVGENVTEHEEKELGNFELSFQRILLFLYSPSPNILAPSESALSAINDSATRMIQLYRHLFPEYRLSIYWQAIECLSAAGIALMFSYVKSSVVREKMTLRTLESLVHACSSVLWGMVEHFPAFKWKRDAFDVLSSEILTDIAQSAHTTNASSSVAGEETMSQLAQQFLPVSGEPSYDGIFASPFLGGFSDESLTFLDWNSL
jgi:hypothetical protein